MLKTTIKTAIAAIALCMIAGSSSAQGYSNTQIRRDSWGNTYGTTYDNRGNSTHSSGRGDAWGNYYIHTYDNHGRNSNTTIRRDSWGNVYATTYGDE